MGTPNSQTQPAREWGRGEHTLTVSSQSARRKEYRKCIEVKSMTKKPRPLGCISTARSGQPATGRNLLRHFTEGTGRNKDVRTGHRWQCISGAFSRTRAHTGLPSTKGLQSRRPAPHAGETLTHGARHAGPLASVSSCTRRWGRLCSSCTC